MKKYTFLLLAFFLTLTLAFTAHAMGVGGSVSAAPNALANVNSLRDVKTRAPSNDDMSKRSADKLDSINSSTQANKNSVLNEPTTPNNNETKATKTAANSPSCKTYDGNIFEKGDPGYKDCIRTIQTDRQEINNIP